MKWLRQLSAAQERERARITGEIVRMRGLMPLLMKRRNGGQWQADERRELRKQLQALSRLSPYFVVLFLPGSVLILPILAWWLDRRREQRPESRHEFTAK